MAMGSISSINRSLDVTQAQQINERTRAAEVEAKKPQEVAGEREKKVLEDLGHPDADSMLVGRSVDGDTSRASRAGIENSREGIVLKKSEGVRNDSVGRSEPEINTGVQERNAEQLKEEKEPAKEKQITSMTGYTDNQVEQLYYQGKISRQDYNEEIERRERIDEQAGRPDVTEEKENPVIEEAKEASQEQAATEVKTEKEDTARQEVKTQEKEVEKSREDTAGEERKQLITEEMENDKEFNARMSEINTMQQDFSLKAEGITQAISNDREELFQNVMEAAEKVAATEPTQ